MKEPTTGPATARAADAERRRTDLGPPLGLPERRRAKPGLKMACPYCGATTSSIVRSRGGVEDDKVRRRRQCDQCGRRFTTAERVDQEVLEREIEREFGREDLLAPPPPATWDNAERLLHRLWGQAKSRQYVKTDWNALQHVLSELRRAS